MLEENHDLEKIIEDAKEASEVAKALHGIVKEVVGDYLNE